MSASKSKYTDEQLADLASLPEQELSVGERIAVGRWRKRLVRENMPVVPVERALEAVGKDVVLEPSGALEAARGLRWYGDSWPAGVEMPRAMNNTRFVVEARALREFAGRVARVESGLTHAQASKMRSRIARGVYRALGPKGAFEARILPEDGSYSVLARFVGGVK